MPYFIKDACVSCGDCERYCPVEAIAVGNGAFVIDPEKCIECGTCFDLCPADAIELRRKRDADPVRSVSA
jgi:ferredoxin